MSDTDPVTKVARDLTEILRLYADLEEQAINDSANHLMPGGRAMVELGPVSNLERWEFMTSAGERLGRAYTSAEDEDPDEAWSAFQLIEFWSEGWRRTLDAEYEGQRRPTIATEANFVRHCLEWARDNELRWDDFAHDINRARVRLEDILTDGRRMEVTRVRCDNCEARPKLLRIVSVGGREDAWKCAGCKKRFDPDAFKRAYAQMLRGDGAQKFVLVSDAVSTLVSQGRGERTVRRWLEPSIRHEADRCVVCKRSWPPQEYPACPGIRDGEPCGGDLLPVKKGDPEAVIEGYCEILTRRTWVFWPDLWRRHHTTRVTPRASV